MGINNTRRLLDMRVDVNSICSHELRLIDKTKTHSCPETRIRGS